MTFLTAVPGLAGGVDPGLPAPDSPGYWRYVTQKDETSTSKCIGDPKTPICAVDTVMACFTRWDDSICDKVKHFVGYGPDTSSRATSGRFMRYRIISARRLRASDIPPHRKTGILAWKPGDLQVTVHRKTCGIGGCGGLSPTETTFTIRRAGGIWTVVTRFTPREQ